MTFVPLSVVHAPSHAPGEVTLVLEGSGLPTALVGVGTTLEQLQVAINAVLALRAEQASEAAPSPACAHRWAEPDSAAAEPAARHTPALVRWASWLAAPASREARLSAAALALLALGALIGRAAS